MKKTILFISALLGFTQFTQAQNTNGESAKKFYIGINTGYALATDANIDYGKAMLLQYYDQTEYAAGKSKINFIPLKISEGINFGANIGYQLNKYLSAEVGVTYLKGSKQDSKRTEISSDYSTTNFTSKAYQIKPTIIMHADFEKLNPYLKLGLLASKTTLSANKYDKSGANTEDYSFEMQGDFDFGFTAGFGIDYALDKNFVLFGEINCNQVNFNPTKMIVTKRIKNGVDILPTLKVKDKETEFIQSFDTGVANPDNEPSKTYPFSFGMSNVGINIGLKYKM